MSKKTKNSKPVSLTKSVAESVSEEIIKSNAKRGMPLPADLTGMPVVVKSGGTKTSLRDDQVLIMTNYGKKFYTDRVLQPQLHNIFVIIHECAIAGIDATVSYIRDTWNSKYGSMVGKGLQDFDQVFFGKYSSVVLGNTSFNQKGFKESGRLELAIQLTGDESGFCELLMVA
tara:strand:+ start:292 stop:807 length:516 start_codon:yes stop_codon:yes gene_type:complete